VGPSIAAAAACSGEFEQCHVASWRRRLNADWIILYRTVSSNDILLEDSLQCFDAVDWAAGRASGL